ncbi:MAG TPA: hypothetical protein VMG12_23060 [Polyangiaceae bacterium]|nr:hypothetical protein [Polyangiaceae bacterium]
MRASVACSRGLTGEGTFDYFGDEGRVRAKSLYVVSRPARLRFDVVSPLGGVLSTLTSDGQSFAFSDLREKQFLTGPADECNLEQALKVPVPPEALGELLTGQAPILVHRPEQARLVWESGSYVLRIDSEYAAAEEVHLVPRDEDWERPWQEQRLRVLEVRVSQQGLVLYEARLDEHRAASTAQARVDADGLEPDVPPSGPSCDAEVPRRVRFIVPGAGRDIVFIQGEVHHNPPLLAGLFQQLPPAGMRIRHSSCGNTTSL